MRNNVGLILQKRAHLTPGLEGWVELETGRRFTYGELDQRANRSANLLAALGVRKGDRVALLLMNGAEYIETFFAVAKLGGINVPLNWRLVPDELAFILKDSGATTLVYGGEFQGQIADLQARGSGGTDVREWIHVGAADTRDPFARDYAALQAEAASIAPEIAAGGSDELYIMYTSGTTGLPKGAVHTHDTAIWAVITINTTSDFRFRDRYLVALPLFHVGALTPCTCTVQKGVTNVVMRSFDPVRAWQAIDGEKVSVMLAVPAMLNFMLQVPDLEKYDHSLLRWCMSGAAPVPVTLIESYAKLGIEIHQVYGLTESCGPACLIGPDDAIGKAGSTGKAFFHTDVSVVDEAGQPVSPGEMGEVRVRGPHVMKGYWNRPEATAEAIRDGWLHTGDLATTDKEGFVYIQDRIKDMIISGGENVYPAEIENVILAHPGVRDAAVIGQPSERWGESPAAIVVRADDALTEQSLFDHCQGKLARFKQPRRVEFVEEIPRNPTGKILKRVLRDRFPGPAPD